MLLKLDVYFVLLTFFLFTLHLKLYAQISSFEEYDSLLAEVPKMTEEDQLSSLIRLGQFQNEKNPNIGLELLDRASILATRLDKPKEEAEIIRLQGSCFDHKKIYNKALELYYTSLYKSRDLGDSLLVAKVLHNIAFSYYRQDDLEASIKYHLENIRLEEEIEDKEGLGYTYNHLGLIYDKLNQYEKSDSYFFQALQIRKETNHLEGLGYTYRNLSISFTRRKDYKLSLEFIDNSSKFFKDLGDTIQYANSLNTKGNIFWYLQDYDKAKLFYNKALNLFYTKAHWRGVILEYVNLGLIEANQDHLEAAERHYLKALKIAEEQAVESIRSWISIYEELPRVAYAQKKYKEAFSYLEKYFTYKEKLAEKNSKERIADLESRYNLEKKEAELAFIKQENKMLELEQRKTILIAALIILPLILISVFLFYLNRISVQKNNLIKEKSNALIASNEELKIRNEELDRFVYTVAHDLKSPINSIHSLTDLLLFEDLSPDINENIHLQKRKLNGLSNFISELLNYTKITKGRLRFENIDFAELISSVLDKLNYDSGFESVRKEIQIPSDTIIHSDYKKLESVFLNLITNAIRYRNQDIDNSYVSIIAQKTTNYLKIIVEDNGIGIQKENIGKIFEKFYRANQYVEGTGLGLAIVKENLLKLGGGISVHSTVNQGTAFELSLPYNSEVVV